MDNDLWSFDQESFAIVDTVIVIALLCGAALVIVDPQAAGQLMGWFLGQIGKFFFYTSKQVGQSLQGLQ